jgi:hypothetical protein
MRQSRKSILKRPTTHQTEKKEGEAGTSSVLASLASFPDLPPV